MNTAAPLDLASIPDRIQSEVQRAIQRSIKGVEYFASSGPSLGSTPKDILHSRGTLNLYHYRPLSDEIYRVPILIVMATTNRGYILDMVPGQSFIEFPARARLRRLYDGLDRAEAEEKSLRMEDYVLDFIPDCVRRVQRDSGETDVTVIGLLLRRRAVAALWFDLQRRADEKSDLLHHPDRFPRDEAVPEFLGQALFRRRPADRQRRQCAARDDPFFIRDVAAGLAHREPGAAMDNIWNDEYVKSYRMFDRWATDTLPLAGEYFRQITLDLMWENKLYNDAMSVGGGLRIFPGSRCRSCMRSPSTITSFPTTPPSR